MLDITAVVQESSSGEQEEEQEEENDGLAGLVECKTKDKRTEASRAEELTKEVNNWCLSDKSKGG